MRIFSTRVRRPTTCHFSIGSNASRSLHRIADAYRSGSRVGRWKTSSARLRHVELGIGVALAAAYAAVAPPALADTPAFDRPGIAFAPTTLPAESLAWEQGLPDFQRDESDGVTQRAYAASARLRYGISDRWELQLAAPIYEQIDTYGSGQAFTAAGSGDLSLALKVDLTPGEDRLDMALLCVVSFPTAHRDISLASEQYSLGATAGWSLGEQQSLALYANVDLLEGQATWTVSPNWGVALAETVGAYLEVGYQFGSAKDLADNAVAGGGLTWMVSPTVQLDAYGLAGLTRGSTDVSAGVGVSVFFK